ncbi:MAG: hypothetical protein EA359_11645 [Balneolaceae bacterium]|nr:MAG: hypothetical protein EA359_11645 [Balneolaceae bacterium]
MSINNIILAVLISLFTSCFVSAQINELYLTHIDNFKKEGDSNVRKWDASIPQAEGTLILSDWNYLDDMMMTDFNITPPTAMIGTFRFYDEITVRFKEIFSSNN